MKIDQLFIEVVNLSLSASMIALVLMGIRVLFKKQLSAFSMYLLWGIVLLRLIIPFSFTSPLSIYNVIPHLIQDVQGSDISTVSKVTFIKPLVKEESLHSTPNIIVPSGDSTLTNDDISQTIKKGFDLNMLNILSVIWLVGCSLILLASLSFYYHTSKKLRRAKQLKGNETLKKCLDVVGILKPIDLYQSKVFNTPIVTGLIQPKIILPEDFDLSQTDTLTYILTHELIHIKRKDNLIKMISLLLVSIHWFNPFVWISYYLCIRDMELSCDERVLKLNEGDIRGAYATSLLALAAKQNHLPITSAFVAFGESDLKTRVKKIMHYKTKTVLSLLISSIIVILVGCSLMSNPKIEPPQETLNNSAEPAKNLWLRKFLFYHPLKIIPKQVMNFL